MKVKALNSVFTRMTILMVFLCTAILIMFYFFFAVIRHRNDSIVSQNLQIPLSTLIAHELENKVKSRERIEQELPVKINPGNILSEQQKMALDTMDPGTAVRIDPLAIVVKTRNNVVYHFHWPSYFEFKRHQVLLIVLGGGVLIIFIFAYFYIKRLLGPVDRMKDAVNDISDGTFDVRLAVETNDEFGQLSNAFNKMSNEIQSMLKAKDQLLSDVSHELRTPITRLRLAAEMIRDKKSKQSMEEDLREMSVIIETLLESNRLAYHPEGIVRSTFSLIQTMKNIINDRTERQINYTGPKDITFNGDVSLIKVLFRNLLDNAIKYSPAESSITIDILNTDHEVTVQMDNDGSGIPEEELKHLFEPFYRVEQSRSKKTGGFGLGLSIARKIVDAHNGSIDILNRKSGGTRVKVILPLE